MGEHINTKKDPSKHSKPIYGEGRDLAVERKRRASFKSYLQGLEENLAELETEAEEWVIKKIVWEGDDAEEHEIATFATRDEAEDEAEVLNEQDETATYVVERA